MSLLRPFVVVSLCLAATAAGAQAPPTEYETFLSHGKPVSCPVYENREAAQTLIFLRGADPSDITLARQEANFFAAHGFRVLVPEYLSVTSNARLTAANYRRWAQVVDDIVEDLAAQEQGKKIALAGQSLGASVALVAGSHRLPIAAIAEWSGLLPNEFFSQIQSLPSLLILHGDADEQVPILNARQLVRLCQLRDFTCEIQIYAGQGHLFTPRIADTANQRVLAFFRAYLAK